MEEDKECVMILNLCSGNTPIQNAVNIDNTNGYYTDEIIDLDITPWKWEDNSVDGIYMIHALEHFKDRNKILSECRRILKVGGFLYIRVPHCSSACALSNLYHYTAFASDTMNNLTGFRVKSSKIYYLSQKYTEKETGIQFVLDMDETTHPVLRTLVYPFACIVQWLIDLSPALFERFWCFYAGGAEEVVFKLEKLWND